MITQDQSDLVAFLSSKNTFHQKKEVLVHTSSLSTLFLTEKKVYKLKHALLSAHTDFSTPEKRKLACLNEIKRSAVYANGLKQTLKTVKKLPDGRFSLTGTEGHEVESLIEMNRLPPGCFLPDLLKRKKTEEKYILSLAETLVDLHGKAKIYRQKGGAETLKTLIAETKIILNDFSPLIFKTSEVKKWTSACYKLLKQNMPLITFRQKSGRVKKCHGDLFLSNIAVFKKEFLFFSPLEHNTVLECIDCLYDLSSILIDLEASGKRALANILLNYYLSCTNDFEGVPLLGLYQSLRGARRAVTLAQKAALAPPEQRKYLTQRASLLFEAACHVLEETPPILIACGGLSKTKQRLIIRHLAPLLNPAPGALILQDEAVKKQIQGLMPRQPVKNANDSPAFSTVLYAVLTQQARAVLSANASVIIDADLTRKIERAALTQVATDLNIPFIGLWIEPQGTAKGEPLSPEEKLYWHTVKTDEDIQKTIRSLLKILQQND